MKLKISKIIVKQLSYIYHNLHASQYANIASSNTLYQSALRPLLSGWITAMLRWQVDLAHSGHYDKMEISLILWANENDFFNTVLQLIVL